MVRNAGAGPITVESIAWVDDAGAFRLEASGGFVLEGRGERDFPVAFAPIKAGAFVSKLRVGARDVNSEQIATITLVGVSVSPAFDAEPDIVVLPFPNFDLGPAIVIPEAPVALTRKLTVFNTGSENLIIDGLEVRPLDEATSMDELEVLLPSTWNPSIGLPFRAGSNDVQLDVRVTPRSVGPKRWELIIRSNDPDEPALAVQIEAEGVVAPPCRFTVSPGRFELGSILSPDSREMAVSVTNRGGSPIEQCVAWNFALAPDSDPRLALVEGFLRPQLIEPGKELAIPLRLSPGSAWGSGPVKGTLEFKISSPARSPVRVPIEVSFHTGCLTISPADLDFGTIRGGCNSTRSFALYNTCEHEVVLTKSLSDGTGRPGG